MLAAIKQQLVETAIFDPLDGGFHTRKPQSRRRLRNRVVTLVGDPDHQRRLALMDGYHRIFSEDEASARPPETGEDQPGHHREERHAGEDFYRGDEMPVMGLRVHVAVTDGGQRLDRKVKKAERLISGDIGDWLVAEPIEKCEHGSGAPLHRFQYPLCASNDMMFVVSLLIGLPQRLSELARNGSTPFQ